MAREITYDTIHEALIAAIEERGADWKYPESQEPEVDEFGYSVYSEYDKWHDEEGSCVFIKNDGSGPACIVGYALDYLGYPIKDIPNGAADDAIRYVVADADTGAYDHEWDYRGKYYPLLEALNAAQSAQDIHKPWGMALDKFEEKYEALTGIGKKEEN